MERRRKWERKGETGKGEKVGMYGRYVDVADREACGKEGKTQKEAEKGAKNSGLIYGDYVGTYELCEGPFQGDIW